MRAHVHKFIALEDENSDYCRLATVNNPLNLVAHYFTQDESHAVRMRSDYQVLYVNEGLYLRMVRMGCNSGTRVSLFRRLSDVGLEGIHRIKIC